jgi:hypothetical protein
LGASEQHRIYYEAFIVYKRLNQKNRRVRTESNASPMDPKTVFATAQDAL